MKFDVVLHPSAAAELEEAYRWIAQESPANANVWYNHLLDKMKTLERTPSRCPPAPERKYARENFRHLIVGQYRIIFLVESKLVRVLHVRHGARRAIGETDTEEIS
ncbi:MAG: type II toxin-antitoxin system RelE/ParE family toxin [Phycisphaerae bacterium]